MGGDETPPDRPKVGRTGGENRKILEEPAVAERVGVEGLRAVEPLGEGAPVVYRLVAVLGGLLLGLRVKR